MKLLIALFVSATSLYALAQKADTPDLIVENNFIKIQTTKGVSQSQIQNSLNSIKNHKNQTLQDTPQDYRLTTEEIILHQLNIGLINSATNYHDKSLPIELLRNIGSNCLKYAHTTPSVAKSCGNEQITNLVKAIKVFVEDNTNINQQWKKEFDTLVDIILACNNKFDALVTASNSVGADNINAERMSKQDTFDVNSEATQKHINDTNTNAIKQ